MTRRSVIEWMNDEAVKPSFRCFSGSLVLYDILLGSLSQ